MTTKAKLKPVTKKTTNKVELKKTTNKAAAFLNWAVVLKDNSLFHGSKGLPIFQNPDYQNDHEDWLIDLAKRRGGSVELTMKVKIVINKGKIEMPADEDII